MAGVHMDLRTAAAAAAHLTRKREREPDQRLELEALQAHVLIRYGCCFKDGVRTAYRIPEAWIDELPVDLRRGHVNMLKARAKRT